MFATFMLYAAEELQPDPGVTPKTIQVHFASLSAPHPQIFHVKKFSPETLGDIAQSSPEQIHDICLTVQAPTSELLTNPSKTKFVRDSMIETLNQAVRCGTSIVLFNGSRLGRPACRAYVESILKFYQPPITFNYMMTAPEGFWE